MRTWKGWGTGTQQSLLVSPHPAGCRRQKLASGGLYSFGFSGLAGSPTPLPLSHTAHYSVRAWLPSAGPAGPALPATPSLEGSLPLAVEWSKVTVLSSSEHIATFLLVPQFPCLLMGVGVETRVGVGAFLFFPVCLYQRYNNTAHKRLWKLRGAFKAFPSLPETETA